MFKELRNARLKVWEILAIAVILGIGSNLVASSLFQMAASEKYDLYFGAALIAFPLLWIVYTSFLGRKHRNEIKIHALIDGETGQPIDIPLLFHSKRMCDIINAAFLENKALQHSWMEYFKREIRITKREHKPKCLEIRRLTKSEYDSSPLIKDNVIVREAVEFLILEDLSEHLIDHFESENIHPKFTQKFTRNDLHQIVLTNSIFRTITEIPQNRESFIGKNIDPNDRISDVLIAADNGAIYSDLTFNLPKNSKVNRGAGFSICIENRQVKLEIRVISNNVHHTLPDLFQSAYLGDNSNSIIALSAKVEISYRVKFLAAITGRRLAFNNWIESFIENLRRDADFETFTNRINWQQISAQLVVAKHYSNKERTN